MAAITASMVGELRAKTDAPMMECKKALTEAAGDIELAIDNLRKSVSVRSRDRLTFHTAVGTTDMTPEDIADNIELIFKRLGMKLEKGTMNIRSAFVKTTMGPSEKVI